MCRQGGTEYPCPQRGSRLAQARAEGAGWAASNSPMYRRSICPVVIPRRLAAASSSIACQRGSNRGSSTTSWSIRATSEEMPSNNGCTLTPAVDCVSNNAMRRCRKSRANDPICMQTSRYAKPVNPVHLASYSDTGSGTRTVFRIHQFSFQLNFNHPF